MAEANDSLELYLHRILAALMYSIMYICYEPTPSTKSLSNCIPLMRKQTFHIPKFPLRHYTVFAFNQVIFEGDIVIRVKPGFRSFNCRHKNTHKTRILLLQHSILIKTVSVRSTESSQRWVTNRLRSDD